jgi:hypothetical protein
MDLGSVAPARVDIKTRQQVIINNALVQYVMSLFLAFKLSSQALVLEDEATVKGERIE